MSEENPNKALATTDGQSAVNSFNAQLQLADSIAKSRLTPFRKKEEVLAVLTYAKELGVGPMTAANNMHVINDKVGLGIHLITAILTAGGVQIEVLEDCVPVYGYQDARTKAIYTLEMLDELRKFNSVKLVSYGGTDENKLKQKEKYLLDYPNDILVVMIPTPIDWRTSVKFTREIRTMSDEIKTRTHIETLLYYSVPKIIRDKDNWLNYMKVMMRNRPTATGGRFFASDLLKGVFDLTELLEGENVNFKTDEDGTVSVIKGTTIQKAPVVVKEAIEVMEIENQTTEVITEQIITNSVESDTNTKE